MREIMRTASRTNLSRTYFRFSGSIVGGDSFDRMVLLALFEKQTRTSVVEVVKQGLLRWEISEEVRWIGSWMSWVEGSRDPARLWA
jgi:hypothetical protein